MRFELDPPLTAELREEIIALWRDVANAGGPVGFAGEVGFDEVQALAAGAFAAVAEGHDNLLVGRVDGRVVAMLFFVSHRFALAAHWRTVKRLMVHPAEQALHLTVRGGTGLERFYLAGGYREVGRLPGALRIGPGDDRDEAHLWLSLG
jgi:hypothetical protein